MILAVILTIFLVATTFVFHYRVLLLLGARIPKTSISTDAQVLVIVLVLFCTHIIEIGFYGLIYYVASFVWGLGTFTGAAMDDHLSFLYYSGVIYTTLGLGDIYPQGHIRFITAIEALNGFMLITWSASFTFLAMGRLWKWDNCCDSSEK